MLLMSALLVVVWGPVKALFFVCAVLCFVSIFTFEIQALLCGDTQELEPGKGKTPWIFKPTGSNFCSQDAS